MTPREPDRFDCHECGVGVKVDEDGCCATCGRDAIEVAGGLPVGPLRDVYLASPAATPAAEPAEPAAPAPDLLELLREAFSIVSLQAARNPVHFNIDLRDRIAAVLAARAATQSGGK